MSIKKAKKQITKDYYRINETRKIIKKFQTYLQQINKACICHKIMSLMDCFPDPSHPKKSFFFGNSTLIFMK